MERLEANAPLPSSMQGRWRDVDEPSFELIVTGGDISCGGRTVRYDYKLVGMVEGALTVSLKTDDAGDEDDFQRRNISELVITPEGEFLAYNVKFVSEFIRADA